MSGALVGGFVGRELSPNPESDNFNTGLGAAIGAGLSATAAYFLFREARPELKLKNSPLKKEIPLSPLKDTTLSLEGLGVSPPFAPITEKKRIDISNNVPKEIQKTAKRQWYRKHKTEEISYEKDGTVFNIPSFEIIETGIE